MAERSLTPKSLLSALLFRLGAAGHLRDSVNRRLGNPLRILSGHRVIDAAGALSERDRADLARGCLSLAELKERLVYLKRQYRLAALGDCVAAGGASAVRGAVVLTFDDGFRDLYTHAHPLLLAERVPVTIFLTTGLVGTGAPMLNADEIREMARAGRDLVSWGAHGVTHRALTEMTLAEAEEEIVRSRREVEAMTQQPVTLFCYPDGKYNAAIQDLLRKHGFIGACATGRTLNAGALDLLALKRIPFESEPLHRFAFRVAGRV